MGEQPRILPLRVRMTAVRQTKQASARETTQPASSRLPAVSVLVEPPPVQLTYPTNCHPERSEGSAVALHQASE